jgi:peptide chain release factor 3
LLEGAGEEFDKQQYLDGKLAPVFFGSALNNFRAESLLTALIAYAPAPLGRNAEERLAEPNENKFSSLFLKGSL